MELNNAMEVYETLPHKEMDLSLIEFPAYVIMIPLFGSAFPLLTKLLPTVCRNYDTLTATSKVAVVLFGVLFGMCLAAFGALLYLCERVRNDLLSVCNKAYDQYMATEVIMDPQEYALCMALCHKFVSIASPDSYEWHCSGRLSIMSTVLAVLFDVFLVVFTWQVLSAYNYLLAFV